MRPDRLADVATGWQTKQRRVEQPVRMETTAWNGAGSTLATYLLITPDSTRRTPRTLKRNLVLVRD